MKFLTFIIFVLAVSFGILLITKSQTMAGEGVLGSHGEDLMNQKPEKNYPIAIFAGGCFWCVESEFRSLDGVLYTRVGYTGGTLDNPTYHDVGSGKTGHAESVEITYDPDKISYKKLVEYFLINAHDPTQLNRQGVDIGPQYRSVIFYQNEEQKQIAQDVVADVEKRKIYSKPIVTELAPASTFWEAEGYHQQYYEKYEEKNGQPHINVFLRNQSKMLQGK